MLTLPKGVEDFVALCDISITGLRAVLMHRGRVIVYTSRQLKLHDIRLMIWSWGGGVFPQDLVALFVWGPVYNLHGSQEFSICNGLAKSQYDTM